MADPATSAGPRQRREPLLRGSELAAGAVDLAAAGVADGGGDALGLQAAYELTLVGRVRGGPLRARGRVQGAQH